MNTAVQYVLCTCPVTLGNLSCCTKYKDTGPEACVLNDSVVLSNMIDRSYLGAVDGRREGYRTGYRVNVLCKVSSWLSCCPNSIASLSCSRSSRTVQKYGGPGLGA